ncbi:MAG TPA: CDP-alcohol phosphatidyltransferase family protein, partial [Jatrophihabitans sp.]|nr:CDP-alcohol phosphatidyltransferase family protein [Jatrophihabitans sp.]
MRRSRFGPADGVTFVRAVLAVLVAAVVATGGAATPIVALASVGLVLDLVDGWVARRTGTASAFGARFDLEVDAFLILVLSVRVAQELAPWALAIGLARYLFVAAWAVAPWLRRPVPPQYWRKTVAAVQGVVLTVAVSGLLPVRLAEGALLVALLLLAESFGRDVVWLWRHERRPAPRTRLRTAARWGSTALGAGAVWFGLLSPDRLEDVSPAAFLRIPVEALVVVAVAMVLPPRGRKVLAALAGATVGVLALLRLLDLGFNETLDRPFDLVGDWGSFGPALGVVRDSAGPV